MPNKLDSLDVVGEEEVDEAIWRERYEIEARLDQVYNKEEIY
jgi:hypothetical protein